ncbi:hypothetical protein MUO14_16740 [Halobacillus shinanisalinarum]|uniref:DUF4352 domain-containing protein n=1 Tax=Halobacillus shinanisalinarum TaxID=2932258 RepID=A0ABY4GVY7_9BACI|nr:hypothetical protein [Halobacillus shinanisalinarum]UOQ92129.1 hypothetical protein MUO14_16740 [Halobacillus shinanisalinarum]
MKKLLFIPLATGLFLLAVVFIYIKLNSPLVTQTAASDTDGEILVIDTGNKGFQEINIEEVMINDGIRPAELKIQVSNPLEGYVVTDNFDQYAGDYIIKDLEEVSLEPGTSPIKQMEKVNSGTATEDDISYGLSIVNDEPITEVVIKYRYLGFDFRKTVPADTIPINQ